MVRRLGPPSSATAFGAGLVDRCRDVSSTDSETTSPTDSGTYFTRHRLRHVVIPTAGVAFAVVAALGLATQAVFLRLATRDGRTADALVVGYAMNLLVIVPSAFVLYYPDLGLTPTSFAAFVTAGLLGSLLGRAFHFTAVSRVGASRAEAVKASQSLLAAFVALLLLGETLTPGRLGAIVLIVAGLVLLATESADDPLTGEELGPRSFAYPLAAAVFFGLQPAVAKVGLAEGTPVLVGLGISLVSAGFGYVTLLRVRGALPTAAGVRPNLRHYLAAGTGTTVFMVAYYSGLAVAPVNVVVPIVQSSPLVVVFVSALALRGHERITPRLVVAASVVVVGAVGVTLLG